MSLKRFYSLRTEFTIIGLTGRVGSGCSEIADKLASDDLITSQTIFSSIQNAPNPSESIKSKICYNFLKAGNWSPFKVIIYKDVLLFHLIHESNKEFSDGQDAVLDKLIEIICQNGKSTEKRKSWENRFDSADDQTFTVELKKFLVEHFEIFISEQKFGCDDLNICLKDPYKQKDLYDFFFGKKFQDFAINFYSLLNQYHTVKRTKLSHDLANNLRASGTVKRFQEPSIEYIYTIAETINRIIKAWRSCNPNAPQSKIIIDALKNSLELMYFKEKYSGFYMVATNRDEEERLLYLQKRLTTGESTKGKSIGEIAAIANEILLLDDAEFKSGDYKKGYFSYPDIENCIQKSDYHIFIDSKADSRDQRNKYLDLDCQLLRLIALITQPGIITPTAIERSMQVAYNAKFNSGCISRQVGAVITDKDFSIKSIGWNDVPAGQIPCNLRSIDALLSGVDGDMFSPYEKGAFKDSISVPINYKDNLEGRNCSFCFKSFQNALEGEKNQVHTRSLHAEENAMMQIAKYGGEPLKGGNLFTTASPCELCSKKAFQLGINNIYYIDPYPGIATVHTLKSGVDTTSNPTLIMFQGAVGRAYHKLYEPFMAYKDELAILTGIDPKPSVNLTIKNLIKDDALKERLFARMEGKSESEKIDFLEKSLGISLEKSI
jgi:deoxycytidylate deaminase